MSKDERARALSVQKAWHASNREHALKRKAQWYQDHKGAPYGLTSEEYAARITSAGRCQICGRAPNGQTHRKLVMDHDHKSGQVRGVLCNNCNRGIGMLMDDPRILASAIEYLESAA